MTDESLKKRLLALASAAERAKMERIRNVFPEIEAAMAAGASRAQIVEALAAEGIEISPKVFSNYVLRIREQLQRDAAAQVAPVQPVVQSSTEDTTQNQQSPETIIPEIPAKRKARS
ncbi:hypothetical protein AACH06_25645 [Ideonella sp. DXS29W]|uniref:Uncharacterized protein n=1 Tax=Ideonella lacteola TaxID=2984193 RepID=A0ABU9BW73_9BURK